MLFSRITSHQGLNSIVVQRYSSVVLLATQSSSRKCLPQMSKLQPRHNQIAKWISQVPTYLNFTVALKSLKDAASKNPNSDHVTSSCGAVEQLVKGLSNARDLDVVIRQCARLPSDLSAVTSLVVSILDRVADLPAKTWLDVDSQDRLRWILYWAGKCRCSTPRFNDVILQNASVHSVNEPADIRQYAYALVVLNIPCKRIAEELMYRFLALAPPVNWPHYHRAMLDVLLYCALSGVDCRVLTSRAKLDLLVKECNPKLLPLALLLTPLHATDQQQNEIDAVFSDVFSNKFYSSSSKSSRCHKLMSYLVGEQYAIGFRQISGVHVHAGVVLSPALRPLNPLTQCPSDVLTDTSIDMKAAQRHGLHIVAAIGYWGTVFLRHPRDSICALWELDVLALQALGCFTIPVRLESQLSGPQTQFKVIPELMFNFPSHIPPFSHYVT